MLIASCSCIGITKIIIICCCCIVGVVIAFLSNFMSQYHFLTNENSVVVVFKTTFTIYLLS